MRIWQRPISLDILNQISLNSAVTHLGIEYVENIYKARVERLSEFNKEHKFGEHYFNIPYDYMNKLLSENIQII